VRERRIDRDGRSFHLLAFPPLPILRRWSIDQLPQLFNILRGEMSFVGPRPERPEFVELFGANLRRHDQPRRVRPGVTGWSQVQELTGDAPLAERVRWDDWYVENWSLGLDARILFVTFRDVCRGVPAATDE
jgi:lipopolysaccharide/colanic/teichoic acid biosynthesis glycosyltransferase